MARRASGLRLFGWYALASAIPIALLGLGLASQYQHQMNQRALDQAASEADAIANAGIEPVLAGRSLNQPLTKRERVELVETTEPLMRSGSVLRLRLRDTKGTVVFDAAKPNQGPHGEPDEEAEAAAEGEVVRELTRLNADDVDADDELGARAVEAYVPLDAAGGPINTTGAASSKVIGVLEIYLPYAPIAHSFASSNRAMTALIMLGLVLLWIALSAISWSVTRRLRISNAENEHLALHDQLTGLPNRTLFGDRAGHAIAAARRSSQPVGIAMVDLDRFKEVNDTLGHHNGDDYLCRIAEEIAEVLRPGDTVARLGGDEFGLVLPNVDATSARPVLERVLQTLAADVDVAGVPVSSEASIGVAFWPVDGTEITEVLQRADLAVHAAKETHQAILEYSADLAHFSPARLALVSQLRHAIGADELVLHYQPKLDLKSNRILSVEALLRWQHPTRGLLVPADFLEIAESTGLIDPLTDWVLDHALGQLATWRAQGLMIDVAVNVSARNLRNENLAESVFGHLAEHGVEPEHLEVEITETALIADPRRAQIQLQRLRDRGVRVSLDDFGQGYTSLAQLGSLPLAELKIDRSFVAGMLTNANDRTIVSTVIDLGHKFGLEVVAEGAESADILGALVGLGCDTAQGFALAPALPAGELTTWIGQYERNTFATAAPGGTEPSPAR
jgi:diguanylate cyclase (GGDEF)-like protein